MKYNEAIEEIRLEWKKTTLRTPDILVAVDLLNNEYLVADDENVIVCLVSVISDRVSLISKKYLKIEDDVYHIINPSKLYMISCKGSKFVNKQDKEAIDILKRIKKRYS